MSLSIKKALSDEDVKQCMNIRFKVFVEGQNVPIQEELDDKDAKASHYRII